MNTAELNRLIKQTSIDRRVAFEEFSIYTVDDAIMFNRQLNALKQFEFLVKDQSESVIAC